jgi:PAS domain S-box-containing protein
MLFVRDVTERKLETEREELRLSMLRKLPVAVIGVDLEGIIALWNLQAEALLLWREDEAIGKNLAELIASAKEQEKISKLLKEEGSKTLEVRRKDGNVLAVRIENSQFVDSYDVLRGYVGVWQAMKGH